MDFANQDNCPKISLVMPSYNQSAFIEETINSILDQRYENLEFMILDGGSTDGSVEIIQKYVSELTYWHSKPDKGQTDALIQGFERATGEIYGWVNSDDILFPGALEHIANAFHRYPQGGIFAGNYVLIDKLGRVIRCKRHPKESGWFGRQGLQIVSPDWFFTRDAYEKVGGLDPDIEFSMDLDLYMKMIMLDVPYIYLDYELMGFRIHPISKTIMNPDYFKEDEKKVTDWMQEIYGVRYKAPHVLMMYRLLQIVNGNYLRSFYRTLKVQGQHWKSYVKYSGT